MAFARLRGGGARAGVPDLRRRLLERRHLRRAARLPPDGLRRARAVGALCIADEVQAGFGRVGEAFWGFAQDEVVPDIVTLGKPMGNGHPMGAVVTTPAIAAEFASRWHFFSTFAGSPVAAAVGSAVLDVIERERLAEQADRVGAYLRARLTEVASAHPLIQQVRGPGLFVGVELDNDAAGTRPSAGASPTASAGRAFSSALPGHD